MPIKRDELGHRVLRQVLDLWGPPGTPGRLTQEDIAIRSSIRQQDLSKMLRGQKPVIPMAWLDAVLRVFGRTLLQALALDAATLRGRPSLDLETADLPLDEFQIVLETAQRLRPASRRKRKNGPGHR